MRHSCHFIPSVSTHANTCKTQGCEGRGDNKGMDTQAHGIRGVQRTVRHVMVYDTHGRYGTGSSGTVRTNTVPDTIIQYTRAMAQGLGPRFQGLGLRFWV